MLLQLLLRNGPQIPGRIRHKFQVDERRRDRAVAEPARQVFDRDAARQQAPSIALPRRLIGEAPALLGLFCLCAVEQKVAQFRANLSAV